MLPIITNTLRKIVRPCATVIKKSKFCTTADESHGQLKVKNIYNLISANLFRNKLTILFTERAGFGGV